MKNDEVHIRSVHIPNQFFLFAFARFEFDISLISHFHREKFRPMLYNESRMNCTINVSISYLF